MIVCTYIVTKVILNNSLTQTALGRESIWVLATLGNFDNERKSANNPTEMQQILPSSNHSIFLSIQEDTEY